MLWINCKIAWRNLCKDKWYSLISIVGLVIGLTISVLGNLFIDYQKKSDASFSHSDRIYTIGTAFLPTLNIGRDKSTSTYSALAPIIDVDLGDVEAVARTIARESIARYGDKIYYEDIIYADSSLLNIFDFIYIHGSNTALDSPEGIVVTEETAIKYFGSADALGKVITLGNRHDFYVTAVIENPKNSHFNPDLNIGSQLQLLVSLKGLEATSSFEHEGDWDNLSTGNFTYVLLPATLDAQWLQTQLNSIFDRITSEAVISSNSGFIVAPLNRAGMMVWDTFGIPLLEIIKVLSVLVLVTACVNYTNLAVAQSMRRSREVGMRKVVGASQLQLLTQFLIEGLIVTAISMLGAIAALELLLPLFNNFTGKYLVLDYLAELPYLLVITLLVAFVAGLYPAWLITKTNPVDALKNFSGKGKRGSRLRSAMVSLQFAISAFMFAVVAIMFVQNNAVEEASHLYPRSEIYTLHRLEAVNHKLDTLQRELEGITGVESVAYSSQVPFEQNNSSFHVAGEPGDEAGKFSLNRLNVSPEFFNTYDIPLIAGRNLDRSISNDELDKELGNRQIINVVVNEMTLAKLGILSAEQAINQRLYPLSQDHPIAEAVIVGVVPTQNIQGLMSEEKPWVFIWDMDRRRIDTASIRITSDDFITTVEHIEQVWKGIVPDRPIRAWFLDDSFERSYTKLQMVNHVMAGFALIVAVLAMVGLLGLAAFYSAQRTSEVGVRKVLGASSYQITRILVWQFSRPVLWALVFALPAAVFAGNVYLNLFGDRIESPLLVIVLAGVFAILLGWITVAGQAYKTARANPVMALRHE